jgi:hypothetical protein
LNFIFAAAVHYLDRALLDKFHKFFNLFMLTCPHMDLGVGQQNLNFNGPAKVSTDFFVLCPFILKNKIK